MKNEFLDLEVKNCRHEIDARYRRIINEFNLLHLCINKMKKTFEEEHFINSIDLENLNKMILNISLDYRYHEIFKGQKRAYENVYYSMPDCPKHR